MGIRAALAVAAAIALPTTASGERSNIQAEQSIYLRGFVPVYCNVELTPSGAHYQDGVVALGESTELCNAPRGYRIVLDTPPGLTDAAILSDDTRIPLSPSGETVLASLDHPSLQTRELALDPGSDAGEITRLGIRIEVNY
jgi:hypothetical protein